MKKEPIDAEKLATGALVVGSAILAYEGMHKLREMKGIAETSRLGKGGLLQRLGVYLTTKETYVTKGSPLSGWLGWS